MLDTDTIILETLLNAQKTNPLLKHFEISYPNKSLMDEVNKIEVSCVSAENNVTGFEFESFTDLVEIVISTKKLSYNKSIRVIKSVAIEIRKELKKNPYLAQRLVTRSISPLYEKGTFHIKKGHILFQFKTEPEKDELSEDEIDKICKILVEDIEVV